MPKLIQSQARGLLSLLTSKDGGLGPAGLEDNLRAVVDIEKYYELNGRRRFFRGQTAAQLDASPAGWVAGGGAVDYRGWIACRAADGSDTSLTNNLIVPEGEIWHVRAVSVKAQRVTGTGAIEAGWAHGMFPQYAFGQLGIYSQVVTAPLSQQAGQMCDFLAMPGTCPAFFTPRWQLAANDFNVDVYVLADVLPL